MLLDAKDIVVPTDFSDFSLSALDVAASEFPGATLHVVHVLPSLYAGAPELSFGLAEEAQRRESTARALRDLTAERGLTDRARVHVLGPYIGNPASEIARLATELSAGLIVVPSHGRTGLQRLALGSAAEVLVRLAHCPVLVLRA